MNQNPFPPRLAALATAAALALGLTPAAAVAMDIHPPAALDSRGWLRVETPDPDLDEGARLAVKALWDGAAPKAGVLVPTVCGRGTAYPFWIHPYDNYWINRVSAYLFPRESTEWPIRLFAAYQAPSGEILGGIYHIPETGWRQAWIDAGGPKGWQGHLARPLADHQATLAQDPTKVVYGIYVRDHLFVLQAFDQWRLRGSQAFLVEIFPACRRALKYLEQVRDADGNGLVETTAVLSDLVVAGDQDIHSTERAEDQVLLHGALQAFARMAEALGGLDDAAWARRWQARIEGLLTPLFWRPEGRFLFGVRRTDKEPVLGYTTTTFANGYAILFGLTTADQTRAILDFMGRQEFVVPGPYHIPPIRAEDQPQNPPGVYCNGGCGWGRGIMPSVTLACFAHGRTDQATKYLHDQAAAARLAGSFHEYWTWEKYAGKTAPGGAAWYGETSAGYLDALLHGLFGLEPGNPGDTGFLVAPHFPTDWPRARLSIRLPNGSRLDLRYQRTDRRTTLAVTTDPPAPVALRLPASDTAIATGPGLADLRFTTIENQRHVHAALPSGNGRLTLHLPR